MKVQLRSKQQAPGALLAVVWLAVTGCTALPPPSRPETPPATPTTRDDAVGPGAALLAQGRAQRAAGNNTQARALIERALAIDSNNAALWVELGEIDLASGRVAEAATMARKALTLAPRDSGAAADASALLQRAERRPR
jgi:Flp pilus assembly protein TadD